MPGRIADELDKLPREGEAEPGADGAPAAPAKRPGVFGRIKRFAKDLLVRQTSTKR